MPNWIISFFQNCKLELKVRKFIWFFYNPNEKGATYIIVVLIHLQTFIISTGFQPVCVKFHTFLPLTAIKPALSSSKLSLYPTNRCSNHLVFPLFASFSHPAHVFKVGMRNMRLNILRSKITWRLVYVRLFPSQQSLVGGVCVALQQQSISDQACLTEYSCTSAPLVCLWLVKSVNQKSWENLVKKRAVPSEILTQSAFT